MKTISRRAWILYLMCVAFLVGAGILLYTFFSNAAAWSMKRSNRHIFSSGVLSTAGKITDSNGNILAQTVDGKRKYNDSKQVRIATMHIVGDSQGYIATGVQTAYDDVLTGYSIVDGVYNLKKYGRGNDIQLTVNSELCATAYEALGKNKGTVGVYNYRTGELLCVVSNPSYDIASKPVESINNDKTGAYEGVYMNRFFSGLYTPGSTFKIITAAAAIENTDSLMTREFTCNGKFEIDGGSVKCMSKHGKLSFEKAMNQSCNSVFSELAVELGADKLTGTAQKAGFNNEFRVDRIRLAKSRLNLDGSSKLDIGWAGVGQYTTLANPCHMLTVIGAIANGGASPKPYFIKQITTPSGKTKYKPKTEMLDEMFSAQAVAQLQPLLRSNVVNNYGDSKFKGLDMCGKTGTAEVSSEDTGKSPHAWFVGYSQRADLPLAIVVVVENGGSGSSVAIPVASKVMQKADKIY